MKEKRYKFICKELYLEEDFTVSSVEYGIYTFFYANQREPLYQLSEFNFPVIEVDSEGKPVNDYFKVYTLTSPKKLSCFYDLFGDWNHEFSETHGFDPESEDFDFGKSLKRINQYENFYKLKIQGITTCIQKN